MVYVLPAPVCSATSVIVMQRLPSYAEQVTSKLVDKKVAANITAG